MVSRRLQGVSFDDFGGSGGIRTHERRKPLPVFKTGAFNLSATLPLIFFDT